MASLQIRDVPNEVMVVLKRLAEDERRSISQQALLILERSLIQQKQAKEKTRKAIEELKKLSRKHPLKEESFVKWIREDRNR